MSRIIAARFDTFDEAESAVRSLMAQKVAESDMNVVYVNPPGQHATYAIGGDQMEDEGAREADTGARTGAFVGGGGAGAIIGTAVAVTAAPLIAPAAALAAAGVGAYFGSLAGTLGKAGRDEEQKEEERQAHEKPARSAGVLLAVCMQSQYPERRVVETLRKEGGKDIEAAEGEWREGRWADFNPIDPPKLIDVDESIVL